ncbi:hypothetical protein [Streptomyces iranensis]|uniref:Uncharacterized protein n=1 Tax=Streptomyces iranensis TaxID=576784 RepID=A0A060ZMM4_9ACTN|nr:hypothetical protein [Streptomyces iranensis]MBP2062420.1 hypothetical protein [Streptomyces iranensis]CDR07370.1 predicted protein [Streptomyces iranensis]
MAAILARVTGHADKAADSTPTVNDEADSDADSAATVSGQVDSASR